MILLLTIVVALLTVLAQMAGAAFWGPAAAAFLAGGLFGLGGGRSFIGGFVGVAAVWGIYAWHIDTATGSLLTAKVAGVFSLPNPLLMVAATALVGGLLGGFSAMTGGLFRAMFK